MQQAHAVVVVCVDGNVRLPGTGCKGLHDAAVVPFFHLMLWEQSNMQMTMSRLHTADNH